MTNLEQRSVQTLGVGHMPRPSRLGGRASAAAQDPKTVQSSLEASKRAVPHVSNLAFRIASNPPTFVAPAFSALRWAIGFAVAMVAHQPLGWLCLGLFCWRFFQTLMRLNTYIERRVQAQ